MPRRTRFSVAVAVLLLCSFLAGCFALGRVSEIGSTLTAGDQDGTTPDPAAMAAGPASGGTLRLSGALPPTLDPALVQDATSAEYIVHLYSGLVRLNPYLTVVGDLASSWDLDDSGRTYTFHLNEGIAFADGREITADDIVYSIERACSPDTGSPVAATYLSDIVGVQDFAHGKADHIAGLQTASPDVVEITIDAPKAYFLARLSYPVSYVVDRDQVEGQDSRWMLHPNGSGPFVLESIDQNSIVLARNDNYYGRMPSLARVEYVLQGGYPITMYENDELDIAQVPPAEIERMLDPENSLHDELYSAPELSITYLGFDVTAPPFDDPLVRQAVAQAIDRDKITDLVLQDTATTAYSILPPGLPDHDSTLIAQTYDPERARDLLASSDWAATGADREIVLATSGTSGYMDGVTQAVVAMLAENLGLDVQVHQVEWTDYLQDLNDRRYQSYITGWIADYPDSENFLDLLFHSQSSQNHTGYANPEVDTLLEEARVESDPSARSALYHQVEQTILADAPWVPLTHGVTWTLVKPDVRGYEGASAIYPWLQDVYREPIN